MNHDAKLLFVLTAAVSGWASLIGCAADASKDDSPFTPELAVAAGSRFWQPNDRRTFPASLAYPNEHGVSTTLNLGEEVDPRTHPFFQPLGPNGRACITCHQPADGMAISAATVQSRWRATRGRDPLFAAIDGSNCPDLPQQHASSHSLLLQRGLFRIARPWPPRAADGSVVTPEFTIEVVRDPPGCNIDPVFGLRSANPTVSVYRRTRPATNLKYPTTVGFAFDPKTGLPMVSDPETGQQTTGNLLADARARTLKAQALDALASHMQLYGDVDPLALQQIVAFETRLYSAQSSHAVAGNLTDEGAQGGPLALAQFAPAQLQSTATPIWSEFHPWKPADAGTAAADAGAAPADAGSALAEPVTAAQREMRLSIARGAVLFTTRTFLVVDSAGVTNIGFGNPVRNPCSFCHNMQHTGLDVAPGQVDLGTTNHPFANPLPDLPLFKLTCDPRFPPHPHLGPVVFTSDPGYALTTGKCVDIGKVTAQSMRGLAARAPYFSNGSAKTLRDVVDFYEDRYSIGLTEQEKQDLVHLMEAL